MSVRQLGAAACSAIATSLAVAAGFSSPATAAVPVGGCAPLFTLISLPDLASLLGLPLEQLLAIPKVDLNGDLLTCWVITPGGRLVGMDNVVPTT